MYDSIALARLLLGQSQRIVYAAAAYFVMIQLVVVAVGLSLVEPTPMARYQVVGALCLAVLPVNKSASMPAPGRAFRPR